MKLSVRDLNKELITPKVSAAGIVESPDRKSIIIIERKYEPLGLASPGGMIEVNETIKECAVREIFEETGVNAKPLGIFKITSNPNVDPRFHVVIVYVIMRVSSFKDPVAGDDAKKAFWMDYKSDKYFDQMIDAFKDTLREYRDWRLGEEIMLSLD